MTRIVLALFCCGMMALASMASAQGVQTGTVTGTVRDQGELPLPGVTITATSPSLQGSRSAATDSNGVYSLAGLPPGTYTVRFELAGMRDAQAAQRVDLGGVARLDATLQLAIKESVEVKATRPSLTSAVSGGANLRSDDIARLATTRT